MQNKDSMQLQQEHKDTNNHKKCMSSENKGFKS